MKLGGVEVGDTEKLWDVSIDRRLEKIYTFLVYFLVFRVWVVR